jgi:hypothetical protein
MEVDENLNTIYQAACNQGIQLIVLLSEFLTNSTKQ